MKKFLVLYRTPVSAAEQMSKATPEQAKAGMDAWMAWAKSAGAGVVDMGAPLGDTALMEGHPHLHGPGCSIELLEQIPIPGM